MEGDFQGDKADTDTYDFGFSYGPSSTVNFAGSNIKIAKNASMGHNTYSLNASD